MERFIGDKLELSRHIILEAMALGDPCVAWSTGKDSTALLRLVMRIRPSTPCYFVEAHEFPESISYRDELARAWGLNLRVIETKSVDNCGDVILKKDILPSTMGKEICCALLKVQPIIDQIKEPVCLTGMRWSEDDQRKGLRYIEEVEIGPQWRVHPLLHWSEEDIHAFLDQEHVPKHPYYLTGYRSLNCVHCTSKSHWAGPERAGRGQTYEQMMFLSKSGYFNATTETIVCAERIPH